MLVSRETFRHPVAGLSLLSFEKFIRFGITKSVHFFFSFKHSFRNLKFFFLLIIQVKKLILQISILS